MSLLTQFYNCSGGGGGSTFPDGVPSMAVGGISGNPVTQIYSTDPKASVNLISAMVTSRYQILTEGNRQTVFVRSDVSMSGGPDGTAAYQGVRAGAATTAARISSPATVPGKGILVFENVFIWQINSVDFSNHSAIYGLSGGCGTYYLDLGAANVILSGAAAQSWNYGYFAVTDAASTGATRTLTWSFPSMTDVTTCDFAFGAGLVGYDMNACAFSTASVDHVLARLLANGFLSAGQFVNLAGTCSPPSAAGVVSKNALIAAGVTVTTN